MASQTGSGAGYHSGYDQYQQSDSGHQDYSMNSQVQNNHPFSNFPSSQYDHHQVYMAVNRSYVATGSIDELGDESEVDSVPSENSASDDDSDYGMFSKSYVHPIPGATFYGGKPSNHGDVFGAELLPGQRYNHNFAPAFDGTESFFAYEEMVEEWQLISKLTPEKRGPALRHRLGGRAKIFAHSSDIDVKKLQASGDEDTGEENGVDYLMRLLKARFVRAPVHVFLYRLTQFLQLRRKGTDYQMWITKWNRTYRRLREAWNDQCVPLVESSREFQDAYTTYASNFPPGTPVQGTAEGAAAASSQTAFMESKGTFPSGMNTGRTDAHKNAFPFHSEHLCTMMFIIATELG